MKLIYYLFLMCCFFLVGCGHNFYFESENIGVAVRIPLPEGGDIGVMAGSTKTVSASVRGGSSFTTETAHGTGLLSDHGVAKVTEFKSNIQVNEGNIEKILTSSNISEKVKLEFVKNLDLKAKAPGFEANVLQTRSALVGSHSANLKNVKPFESTGVDKIVETVPAVVGSVSGAVAEVTESVTSNVIPHPGKTIVSTVENIRKSIGHLAAIAACGAVLGIVLLFFTKGSKKKKPPAKPLDTCDLPPDMIQPNAEVKAEKDVVTDPFANTPPKKKQTFMMVIWVGLAVLMARIWGFLPLAKKVALAKFLTKLAVKLRKKKKEQENK